MLCISTRGGCSSVHEAILRSGDVKLTLKRGSRGGDMGVYVEGCIGMCGPELRDASSAWPSAVCWHPRTFRRREDLSAALRLICRYEGVEARRRGGWVEGAVVHGNEGRGVYRGIALADQCGGSAPRPREDRPDPPKFGRPGPDGSGRPPPLSDGDQFCVALRCVM